MIVQRFNDNNAHYSYYDYPKTKHLELDGFYMKFKKPEAALEVKWKSKVRTEDLKTAESNL